jgi:hypothetical protein
MIGVRMAAALLVAPLFAPCTAGAIEFSAAQRLHMDQNAQTNAEARWAAIGDLNGDGRTDVVFLTDGHGSQDRSQDFMAYVYEQRADGIMGLQSRFTLAPGGTPVYDVNTAVLADLDGDGRAEILLSKSDSIGILKRSAAGIYTEVASVPRPERAYHMTAEDIDKDGRVDLLVQSQSGYMLFYGRGNLQLAPPLYILGHASGSHVLADIDGDDVLDVVSNIFNFSVSRGIGFQPGVSSSRPDPFRQPLLLQPLLPANPYVSASSGFITVGRFLGDPQPQIAQVYVDQEVIDNIYHHYLTLAFLGWSDDGRLPPRVVYRLEDWGSAAPGVQAHDIDGDGDDDLVLFYPGQPRILLQHNGTFLPTYFLPRSESTANQKLLAQHIADFNGDGCLDIGYPDRGMGSEGSSGYSIHYRLDCPSANASATPKDPQNRSTQHDPAKPLLHPDVRTSPVRSKRPKDIQAPRRTR